jgi:ribosomal protein S15P/S13E
MPTQSHIEEEPKDDGSTREKLVVEFSNGSLQQLRDLAEFFKIKNKDPYETINLAIGFLEKIKENNQKSKEATES